MNDNNITVQGGEGLEGWDVKGIMMSMDER